MERESRSAASEELRDQHGSQGSSTKRKWNSVNYGTSKMHDSNIHKVKPPDFDDLAKKYPGFALYVKRRKDGSPFIDWVNPDAVREFTKAILQEDYQIKIELPPDQLCPTVPSRANYIHWIHDLINPQRSHDLDQSTVGIDIGTGASCIYPLLGTRCYGWSFLATDIDPQSIKWAQENVSANEWNCRIELKLVQRDSRVLLDAVAPDRSYAFCMCNPPFFENLDEACTNPDTVCTGTENELVYSGGEVAFVSNIVADSLLLGTRVRWYTSLLGRKSSVKPLRALLAKNKIINIQLGEFTQGKTTRWAIAWSFTNEGMAEKLKTISKKVNKNTSITIRAKNALVLLQKAKEILTSVCDTLSVDGATYFVKGATAAFSFELRILQFALGQYSIDMRHKTGDKDLMAEFFHETLVPALQAVGGS